MAATNAKQAGANQNAAVQDTPLSNTEMAQRYNQVQTLELEDSATARFAEMSAYIDRLTTELAKTADKRFSDLENELEARDRRQTQHRRRMVSTMGESIKGLAKDA